MGRIRTLVLLVVAVAIAAAVVTSGIVPRLRARQVLRRQTDIAAEPTVTVLTPKRQAASEEVVLPGNIQAFADAPIYARTSGYLKRWYFDIGSRVKQGQLLAEIESPEVDRQLQQARSDLGTAQANLKLAQITAARYVELFKQDSVAKQEVDNAVGDQAAKSTIVKSVQANVERLEQLVSFEEICAPFDGVVTARNTDTGQLIDSGSAGGTTHELFHVSAIDKLRVFVNVPQMYSHVAVPGMKVDLTLPELPGRRFEGKLARTADSMDQSTRTLLVEVDVMNSSRLLFPGAYAEAHFAIGGKASTLLIPSTSLIFRSEGLRVPVVVEGNKTRMMSVTLGRDFGQTVEVIAGLSEQAKVIANPPDSLVEGELVRVVAPREQRGANTAQ